jgi:hypothetical protein
MPDITCVETFISAAIFEEIEKKKERKNTVDNRHNCIKV